MRQVLPVVGGIVGAYFGGPQGAQIGFAIGSLIGNAVDPLEVQGNKLGDAPTQTAGEGGARAIVFGKGCVRAVVVIERGGRRVVKQRDKSGKGGGPVTVNERALWTYAIGIGEAIPGGAILRIWENEKLVYDVTPTSQIVKDSTEFAKLFRFYDGAEDQLPDPAIEAIYTDPTDAPYYRGTAYIVFPQRDLTDFGEAVPVYRVEVAASAYSVVTTPFSVTTKQISYTSASFSGISRFILNVTETAEIGATYRFVGLTGGEYLANPPADARFKLFSGADSTGALIWDPGWIGDPTHQSGMDTAIAAYAGGVYAAWAGPIDLVDIEIAVGYGPARVFASDVKINLDFALDDCSFEQLVYTTTNHASFAQMIQYIAASDVPTGAVQIVGFPGFYRGVGGEIYEANWDVPFGTYVFHRPANDLARPGDGQQSIAVSLASVISTLHSRCGHSASDYDVSALGELIDGVVIESTLTGAEAINSIVGTHWADPAEYDGKIRYIKRGAPVARTLTVDDLIDEPETWQRNNAIEYPAKMHFFGQIADLAYASVKATSARYSADVKVVGEASVSSPETFNTSQRPYEIAAILHKIMWTEAGGEVTWRVTDQHLDLVPTDCVGLSWAGQLWRARITQIEADPGELKLKMMLDRQSAYTANLTAIPIPPAPTPPQTSIVSDTALAVLDIPALVDAADDLHIVTAMSGETDAWAGGTLQRSLDDGASFATVSSSTLNAIMGTLQAPVTAASPHYTDTTNVVEVLLYMDDEIEAITEHAFRSEGGAFALSWDDSGTQRWELMQYRDAELIAPKVYRLTTLARGRLDTSAAAHPIGAIFVLLDGAIQRQAAQSAWIGTDLTHRAVSNGHTPDTADEQTMTYAGSSQREFPVAHLTLYRAADDVTATVVPRHRFGTDDAPLRSLNWDGYRWTATDGTNTITRVGTTETENFDVTGWASPVTVTVAQLNRITGAGPSATEGIA